MRASQRDDASQRPQVYKKNDKVFAEYDNEWWPATIKFKYRGSNRYAVKYEDDEGNEEGFVDISRLRPRS